MEKPNPSPSKPLTLVLQKPRHESMTTPVTAQDNIAQEVATSTFTIPETNTTAIQRPITSTTEQSKPQSHQPPPAQQQQQNIPKQQSEMKHQYVPIQQHIVKSIIPHRESREATNTPSPTLLHTPHTIAQEPKQNKAQSPQQNMDERSATQSTSPTKGPESMDSDAVKPSRPRIEHELEATSSEGQYRPLHEDQIMEVDTPSGQMPLPHVPPRSSLEPSMQDTIKQELAGVQPMAKPNSINSITQKPKDPLQTSLNKLTAMAGMPKLASQAAAIQRKRPQPNQYTNQNLTSKRKKSDDAPIHPMPSAVANLSTAAVHMPARETRQRNSFSTQGVEGPQHGASDQAPKDKFGDSGIQHGSLGLEGTPGIDFSLLPSSVLQKYHHCFKTRLRSAMHTTATGIQPMPSRDELISSAAKHFSALEAKETDVLAWFIYSVRNKNNLLRLPPPPVKN